MQINPKVRDRVAWWRITLYLIASLLAAMPLVVFIKYPKVNVGELIGGTAPELMVSLLCLVLAHWKFLMNRMFQNNYLLLGTLASFVALVSAAIFIVWCFVTGAIWNPWAPEGVAFLVSVVIVGLGVVSTCIFYWLYRQRVKKEKEAKPASTAPSPTL